MIQYELLNECPLAQFVKAVKRKELKVMVSVIVVVVVAIVAMYTPRHRIVKCKQQSKVWYVPQETTLFWMFWRDMEYAISPYSERTYRFDTLEEAKNFLKSLHEDKVTKTVVKYDLDV